jgi:hypothetical protein
MRTVATPEVVARSFKQCRLADLPNTDCDEAFLFLYPSADVVNEENGDGDLVEIHDYASDFSWVNLGGRDIPANPDTIVHYR